jgi:ribosomal protein S12 methylthiotransferase accessory factor
VHLPNPSVEDIAQIEEHVLWPLLPENRQAFEFVLSSSREAEIPQAPEGPADILDSIMCCVERIARAGLEVIAVDVTSPDIRECGLHVFRVVIPGAQPLYFGSGLHRISVRATSTDFADRAGKRINLHPHPFP